MSLNSASPLLLFDRHYGGRQGTFKVMSCVWKHSSYLCEFLSGTAVKKKNIVHETCVQHLSVISSSRHSCLGVVTVKIVCDTYQGCFIKQIIVTLTAHVLLWSWAVSKWLWAAQRQVEQNVFAGVCWNKAFVNIRFTITDDELQIKLGQKEITSFINWWTWKLLPP